MLALVLSLGPPRTKAGFFNTIAQYWTLGLRNAAPESGHSFSAIFFGPVTPDAKIKSFASIQRRKLAGWLQACVSEVR